jgi:hypothetical protein
MSAFQAQSPDAGAALPRVQTIGRQEITRHPKQEVSAPAPIKRGVTQAPVRRVIHAPIKTIAPAAEAEATAPVSTAQPITRRAPAPVGTEQPIRSGVTPAPVHRATPDTKPATGRAPAPARIATGEPVGALSEAADELVSAKRFFGKLAAEPDGEKPEAGERSLPDENYVRKIGSYWNQILGHLDHKTGWFIPLTIRNVAVAAASEQEPAQAPRAKAGRYDAFTRAGTQTPAKVDIKTGDAKTAGASRATGKPAGDYTKKVHGLAALADLLPGSVSHDSV